MNLKRTTIVLDRERHLRLTFRGMQAFTETTGIEMAGLDLQDLTPREMQVLVWACLISDDKTLTPEDIPALIEHFDGPTLAAAILEAIENSLPESKPSTAVPLDPSRPIGSASGASGDSTLTKVRTLSGD